MVKEINKLRIGIVAHEFLINIGANDFLKNVLRGLALRSENDIVFLAPGRSEGYAFYAQACPRMEIVACSTDILSLAKVMEEQKLDMLMPSIHILPSEIPHVTYWPDCQPKHFPEFFDDESQKIRDKRILGLLATGRPMIVNSRAAKADMQEFYLANPDQIFDLPFAPILEFANHTPRPELAAPYGLTRPYFIVCNQFWMHKSIETVIQAAAIARDLGMDADIVFTGRMEEPRRPSYIDGLNRMIEDMGIGNRIKLLGYVPKTDQLELIKAAVAVIQPTLFEGGPGGGSVYDAVSLGVRAIVSDIPINYELPLRKDYLVTFKTRDATDLVEKMQAFLEKPYTPASPEDLYQLSRRSAEKLSNRLYQAVDVALGRSKGQAQNERSNVRGVRDSA